MTRHKKLNADLSDRSILTAVQPKDDGYGETCDVQSEGCLDGTNGTS